MLFIAYLALIAVGLHSALGIVLRALTAPSGHATIGASVDNSNFVLKVTTDGQTYVGSTSLTTALLWFAGPPLLLFIVWLMTRRAPAAARDPERDYRIS